MNEPYAFVIRMNSGLVRFRHPTYGQELWTRGRVRRFAKKCAMCGMMVQPKEWAYAPLTNGHNRMHRICERCAP